AGGLVAARRGGARRPRSRRVAGGAGAWPPREGRYRRRHPPAPGPLGALGGDGVHDRRRLLHQGPGRAAHHLHAPESDDPSGTAGRVCDRGRVRFLRAVEIASRGPSRDPGV
ncbi:MAG: hypothetical protein AVDCRST_MAG10-3728, partial [uncultured Acidimicrobiales bacterium]